MGHRKLYNRAVRFYENSVCEDGEKQIRILEQSIEILQRLIETGPKKAEYFHVLGLCWYRYPVSSPERSSNVEEYLKKALSLDPEHNYAGLYLGHFYFDEGLYAKALERFASADTDFYERIGQIWRVLKNEELMLCCRLYLSPREISEKDIDNLCQRYEAVGRNNTPVPLEIVDCFNHLCQNRFVQPSHYSGMVERVLKMIESLKYERALKDRIELLKGCDSVK